MMKIKILFTFIVVTAFNLLCAASFNHTPPTSAKPGEGFHITLNIEGDSNNIDAVKIFYKDFSNSKFLSKENNEISKLDRQLDFFFENNESKTGIEYYFEITYKNGFSETLPKDNPQTNTFKIQFEKSKSSNVFTRLSPDKESIKTDNDLLIAISFLPIADQIVPETLRFYLNGKDLTHQLKRSENMVLYIVKKPLPKTYNYHISAELNNGKKITSPYWKTEMLEPSPIELPYNLSGQANVRLSTQKASYSDSSETESEDNLASLSLRLKGYHRWLRFYSKLYLSSRNSTNSQRVNRYLLNLNSPFYELNLGDVSENFSNYSVFNTNIRGFYSNLHFKYFRFKTIYGTSQWQEDGFIEADSLTKAGEFNRKTFGLKTEFGPKRGIEFNLNFVKNKDKISSLDEKYYFNKQDSTYEVTPKDNIVLGSGLKLPILKNRLKAGFEINMSFYNSNTFDGVISRDSLASLFDISEDDIPADPSDYDNLFIFNKNIEPIKPGRNNLAYEIFLSGLFMNNLINFNYSEIGPAFYSLSSSQIQKDQRKLTISDNLNLWNNRLMLNLGFNHISDNITNSKETTTTTSNWFSSILIRKNKFPDFNLGFNISNSENDNYDLNSGQFNISSGYRINQIKHPTKLNLYYSFSNSNTNYVSNEYKNMINYLSINAITKYDFFPFRTKIGYSLSLNNLEYDYEELETNEDENGDGEAVTIVSADSKYSSHSLYFNTDFHLYNDRLKPFLKYSFNIASEDEQNSHYYKVGSTYNLRQKTILYADFGYKMYRDNEEDYDYYAIKFTISQKF